MRGRRHPTEVKARAVTLRQQGHSLGEISDTLHVSKITVQGWVAHIGLTEAQCQRIREKAIISAARGRPLAVEAWRKKIAIWKEGIYHQVQHLGLLPFEQAAIGQLTCGLLYICEGGKYPATRGLSFANTDPRMIRLFLLLLRQHFPVQEEKLRLRIMHRWDQNGEQLKQFWSQVTAIPLTQCYRTYADRRTRRQPTRRTNYQGICHIQYLDTALQYRLQAIGESVLDLVGKTRGRPLTGRADGGMLNEPKPPRYRARPFVSPPEHEEVLILGVPIVNVGTSMRNGGAGGA